MCRAWLCVELIKLCSILHESSSLRSTKELATFIANHLGDFGLGNHKLKLLLNFGVEQSEYVRLKLEKHNTYCKYGLLTKLARSR